MNAGACLIVGAWPDPGGSAFYRELLATHRMVIAADAAGEWCVAAGRVPDVVVGDFDSARPGAADRLRGLGARVVELPVMKDLSDLAACADEARSAGVDGVEFCAAFGGRIDHTLAAIGTVIGCADLGARICEPDWTAWALDGASMPAVEMTLAAGELFSLLAPGGASGVTIRGATYPLEDGDLPPLSSLGVSNAACGSGPVRVSVREGALLVVHLNA